MFLSLRGAVLADLEAMKSTLLLDTTFVSDLDAELTRREAGPARTFFERMRKFEVFVSVVTLEEFYGKRGARGGARAGLTFFGAGSACR